jgi:1,4-dihydroxy-2-naphthoate octaprenyltransferase
MTALLKALPAIRPPFLILAPICVGVGLAFAHYNQVPIHALDALLCILGAVFAAIWVNTLNEYQDFKSGLDFLTNRTAFSGGSGLLVRSPDLSYSVKRWIYISATITIGIGLYLSLQTGFALLPIGLVGVAIVVSYTLYLNKLPWLCLVAPGVGFALIMPIGSFAVQASLSNIDIWLVSLVSFFPINNLLLVNQLPDLEADKQVGRNHLAIAFGVDKAITVYATFLMLAFIALISLVIDQRLPLLSLIVLLPLCLGAVALPKLIELKQHIRQSPVSMAMVVAAANLTPLCLAISLVFATS